MDTIVFKFNETNFKYNEYLLYSLLDNGWNGKWKQTDSFISIYKAINKKLVNFNNCFDYNQILRLIICICNQIERLKKYNLGIINLDLSDILIINNEWFIINLNNDNLFNLNENGYIKINYPIKNNKYSSLEVKNINILPFLCYYTNVYFNLALICLDLLDVNDKSLIINDNLINQNNKKSNVYKFKLSKIYGSQLYFLFKRFLNKNPLLRKYLLI